MTIPRIVVTGGPGAGKTASIEMARRSLCDHVAFASEAASIVYGGGFPRLQGLEVERAAQRAIYHVQHELEALYDRPDFDVILCDRGSLDGLAYWPGDPAEFYLQLGTSHEAELARYALVVHLRPPTDGNGYERKGLRIETAAEAARIDARIERAWRGHPRRVFVPHTDDFVTKVGRVLAIVNAELGCAHAGVVHAAGAR